MENHPLLSSEDDTAEYQREVLDEIPVVSTISNIETNGVLEDKGFELAQEDENQVGLSAKTKKGSLFLVSSWFIICWCGSDCFSLDEFRQSTIIKYGC